MLTVVFFFIVNTNILYLFCTYNNCFRGFFLGDVSVLLGNELMFEKPVEQVKKVTNRTQSISYLNLI